VGELKSLNFRDKPPEVRRGLKFLERRHHERVVCDETGAFAATSSEIALHLVTRFGVDAARIFFFPPCVDRTLFRRYEGEELDRTYRYLASRSGLDEALLREGRIVFETSRMDGTKRKDLLVEAFARAAADLPDAYLFIGGGPENDVFRQLEARLGADPALGRKAFLLGFIPDEEMYPLFSIADVFATPSEMEGFGMSASQAAAAGTAVVSSDLVPFSTLFVPEHAVVVPAGDVGAFASAMRALLLDPEASRKRGERLAEATRQLDWDVQTRRFVSFLAGLGMDVATPWREA
jgi:glycosyltransferase involved in cell wall biosynthesis